MAALFEVRHSTTYKYANPVTFGAHRAMFLPRRGPRGHLVSWSVKTNLASKVRWVSDALSNAVTVIEFGEGGQELTFVFEFRGIHFGAKQVEEFPLEPRAEEVPVQYTPDEWTDLVVHMRPHAEDPDGSVAAWAKSFTADNRGRTTDVLRRMLDVFRDTFNYNARQAEYSVSR